MRNSLLALLLFLPLSATVTMAADADAPLKVNSDNLDADRSREVSVFIGNVRIEKGSILILADEARLRAHEGEVQEGTLLGSPVRFRQQPEGEALIEGEARRIEYDAANRIIELTGNAWVRQGGDEFRGETIRYHMDEQRVLATSDRAAKERVQVIFQPREQDN